jgi:hypothetical protein
LPQTRVQPEFLQTFSDALAHRRDLIAFHVSGQGISDCVVCKNCIYYDRSKQ